MPLEPESIAIPRKSEKVAKSLLPKRLWDNDAVIMTKMMAQAFKNKGCSRPKKE